MTCTSTFLDSHMLLPRNTCTSQWMRILTRLKFLQHLDWLDIGLMFHYSKKRSAAKVTLNFWLVKELKFRNSSLAYEAEICSTRRENGNQSARTRRMTGKRTQGGLSRRFIGRVLLICSGIFALVNMLFVLQSTTELSQLASHVYQDETVAFSSEFNVGKERVVASPLKGKQRK